MKETALEYFPVKTSVSLDGGVRLEVLNVCESLACSEASIEGDVDLESSVKVFHAE